MFNELQNSSWKAQATPPVPLANLPGGTGKAPFEEVGQG